MLSSEARVLAVVHGRLGHVRLAGASCERQNCEAAADARPQAPRRRHRGPHLAEALSFHSTSSTAGRRGRRWRTAAKHTRSTAGLQGCIAISVGHAFCSMGRTGKLTEREILAVLVHCGQRYHAGKRPFEPDLRGQEFIKMLQCT